jgi:hypothetical protein
MLSASVGDSNCFTVFGLLRSVTFEVDSTLDRDRWVAALRACVAFNVEVQRVKCVKTACLFGSCITFRMM